MFQYFDEKKNKATHTEVQFLDQNSSEFPKFVFCIPEKKTHLKELYERQLIFRLSNESTEELRKNWFDVYPKFEPAILDYGFAATSNTSYKSLFQSR